MCNISMFTNILLGGIISMLENGKYKWPAFI